MQKIPFGFKTFHGLRSAVVRCCMVLTWNGSRDTVRLENPENFNFGGHGEDLGRDERSQGKRERKKVDRCCGHTDSQIFRKKRKHSCIFCIFCVSGFLIN